jgi:hypothetical protein
LIVESVGGGDGVKLFVAREFRQPLIAEVAGGVLEAQLVGARMFADIRAAGEEWQVVLASKFGDEVFVGVGFFASQLMVEMGDSEDNTVIPTQLD